MDVLKGEGGTLRLHMSGSTFCAALLPPPIGPLLLERGASASAGRHGNRETLRLVGKMARGPP